MGKPHANMPFTRQRPGAKGSRRAPAHKRAPGFSSLSSLLQTRRRTTPGAGPCRRVAGCSLPGSAPRMAMAGILAVAATGCAVGVTPSGKSVVGLEVGEGATTLQRAGEFATGIAPILPPPFGEVAGLAGLVLAGGAGEIARRKTKAQLAAEREKARLQGREEGWDEREAAAVPKPAAAPLPTGAA